MATCVSGKSYRIKHRLRKEASSTGVAVVGDKGIALGRIVIVEAVDRKDREWSWQPAFPKRPHNLNLKSICVSTVSRFCTNCL